MTHYAAEIALCSILVAIKETKDPILRRSLFADAKRYRDVLQSA